MMASPTVGSVRPPVHSAAASATLIASASPSLSMKRPPPLRWIQEISESGRNRAALPVQGGQDVVHRGQGAVEVLRWPHHEPRARPQRCALGNGDNTVAGADAAP